MKMFNVPNLLTAMNMLCGVFAILLACAGRIDIAPYFIFVAAILDFFDGFAARLLKQQGELGKQLDSLADVISFGVAPGVIMLYMLIISTGTGGLTLNVDVRELLEQGVSPLFSIWLESLIQWKSPNLLPLCALVIPFFSIFRLAKFNIDTRQSDSFIGLPTPANTIFFVSIPLIYIHSLGPVLNWEVELAYFIVQPQFLIPVITVMSLLLIAELPLFALKFKQFGWKGNEIRYSFLGASLLLLVLIHFWAIPIIIILYLLLSVVNNYASKNKTHEI